MTAKRFTCVGFTLPLYTLRIGSPRWSGGNLETNYAAAKAVSSNTDAVPKCTLVESEKSWKGS